jgi:hypothetical protein
MVGNHKHPSPEIPLISCEPIELSHHLEEHLPTELRRVGRTTATQITENRRREITIQPGPTPIGSDPGGRQRRNEIVSKHESPRLRRSPISDPAAPKGTPQVNQPENPGSSQPVDPGQIDHWAPGIHLQSPSEPQAEPVEGRREGLVVSACAGSSSANGQAAFNTARAPFRTGLASAWRLEPRAGPRRPRQRR